MWGTHSYVKHHLGSGGIPGQGAADLLEGFGEGYVRCACIGGIFIYVACIPSIRREWAGASWLPPTQRLRVPYDIVVWLSLCAEGMGSMVDAGP